MTYFVYSEQALMGELDKDGKLQRAYGFNPVAGQQGLWSTDPIWQADAVNGSLTKVETGYHYLHTDHLGTPYMATDKTGAITWKAISEAFGATNAVEDSVQVSLRFPGQYWDPESDSHYNFYRDYKSQVGRYLQNDPIGLDGGLNLYAYSNANPLKQFDSTGELVWFLNPWTIGGVLAIVSGAVVTNVVNDRGGAGSGGSGTGGSSGSGKKDGVGEWNKKPPKEGALYTCRYVMYFPEDQCKSGQCPEFVTGRGYGITLSDAMFMARTEAQSKIPRNCAHQHHGQMWCQVGGNKPFMPSKS